VTRVPATYPLERVRFGHYPGGTAWIENDRSLIDEPGEWCVDAKARKLVLKPRGDGPPEGILAPALTEIIRVEGRIDYDGPADRPVRGLLFRGLTFLHGRRNAVERNEIHHSMERLGDGNAVYISGTGGGNVVRANFIHHADSPNMNAAIRCDDDQHAAAITHNVVWHTCGEGFIIKGNNTVANNVFADLRSTTTGGVANRHQRGYIVLPYGEPQGSAIRRNVFLSRERGQAVVFHGHRRRRGGQQSGGFLWECEADRNLYWNTADPRWADAHLKQMRAKGAGKGSLAADPQLVDPARGDFRLEADSPARRLGIESIDVTEAGLTDAFPDWLRPRPSQ